MTDSASAHLASAHKKENIEESKPIQILLVDDHLPDALHTQAILKDCKLTNSFEVVHFTEGQQALNYIHQVEQFTNHQRPDLVLLDLDMPNLCGRVVLKKLEEDQSLREVPVIVLTNEEVSSEDAELLHCSHAHCYLHKPLDLQAFVHAVSNISTFGFTIMKFSPPSDCDNRSINEYITD